MKITRIITLLLSVTVLVFLFGKTPEKNISSQLDTESLYANIAMSLAKPEETKHVLQNYPFPLLSPAVIIAEGFEAYDGNLGDTPGAYHWAIDYVQIKDNRYVDFPVYSTHDGIAFQGWGKTWGKFVVIRYRDYSNKGFNTLYSHLNNIPENIPQLNSDFDTSRGIPIKANTYIGDASTTGNTKGVSQLHFELHLVGESTKRIDPYGIYKRLSSGLYPAPGQSLEGLNHFWNSNFPSFATEIDRQ